MYLLINETQYSVKRRIKTDDTVKYLSVTPDPGEVSGVIQMYRNDGFLMSEDNAADYQRQTYTGTLLTLTNKPEPVPPEPGPEPEPQPVPEYLTVAELADAIREGVNSI